MKRIHLLTLLLFLLSASACQKELQGDITGQGERFDVNVRFRAVAGNDPLQFNTAYSNPSGETYTVTAFKYYIYRIELLHTESGISEQLSKDDQYYLIDAADASTATIPLKAAARSYNRIAFTIGVDSIRNVSGAQTGALDPAKGMFWTWNSGYIMAKLEGNSPFSSQPNNKIEYHIGGFRQANTVIKRVSLPFPGGQALAAQGGTTSITVSANVNAWFRGAYPLRIAAEPVCMTPGDLAVKIAANYSGMFTVTEVERN
jgi:hypothetical protein